MKGWPIGIVLETFRLPFPQALDKAREMGVRGVQVYATCGELYPAGLEPTARRDFSGRFGTAGF